MVRKYIAIKLFSDVDLDLKRADPHSVDIWGSVWLPPHNVFGDINA